MYIYIYTNIYFIYIYNIIYNIIYWIFDIYVTMNKINMIYLEICMFPD